jgi:formate-dependent phosphoribosylglycinamide formyltransferase (GAR transformylase)
MGAIQVKDPSTQGTQSHLVRAQPRAKAADLGGFTSRLRVPSSNGRTFGSPEAQASRRSNLGQIATPTDCIAGAFNARID